MKIHDATTPIKYIAELSHVREVALVGTADLAFWNEQLRHEELSAATIEGKAQVLLTATDAKYKGLAFRELSIAVYANDIQDGTTREGLFLAHAFNSSRLLAWCERNCFSTPYYHAQIQVAVGPPASFEVIQNGRPLVKATMAANVGASGSSDPGAIIRKPLRSGDDGWSGPIFLPRRSRRANAPRKVFVAKLEGHTLAYAFDPTSDAFTINPSSSVPALQCLLDSNFTPDEWTLRANANHARSKTYRRLGVQRNDES